MSVLKCIYFSRFSPDTNGGGGYNRSRQILELFSDFNIHLITPSDPDSFKPNPIKRLTNNIWEQTINKFYKHNEWKLWNEIRRDYVYNLRSLSKEWATKIKRKGTNKRLLTYGASNNINLIFMDDPIYFAPLVKKLAGYNVPIIALSQNLEALVPSNTYKKNQRKLLVNELKILSKCWNVITISREESFLLNNLNINNTFLPYYPPETLLKRLLNVRKERVNNTKNDFLLLGNIGNHETRYGVIKVIKEWQKRQNKPEIGKLFVAGYKADILSKYFDNNEQVHLLGHLTNEEFDNLLSRIKACICYQEKGGGILTRICDMLVAGVPVLANSHALRSYYHTKGVIEFDNLENLISLSKTEGHFEFEIPLPHKPDTATLSSKIIQKVLK